MLFEHGFKLKNTSNNIAYGFDVVMASESLQSMPFCLEKFRSRKGIV